MLLPSGLKEEASPDKEKPRSGREGGGLLVNACLVTRLCVSRNEQTACQADLTPVNS